MPLAGMLLSAAPASAQVACYDATAGTGIPASSEMCDLGTLSGGGWSHANGMSPDGNVIVGWSNDRAFRWDSVSGMVDIGALSGGTVSDAIGVNSDGSVVVGWSGSSVGVRAFVWRTYMQDLENLVGSFDLLVNDTDLAISQQRDTMLVGYGYDAAPGGTISGALRLAQPAFGTAPSASAVFQYEVRF